MQRIRVLHDSHRRIRVKRTFCFSAVVSADVELKYEKCFGICSACGFFVHGSDGCDKALLVSEKAQVSSAPGSVLSVVSCLQVVQGGSMVVGGQFIRLIGLGG